MSVLNVAHEQARTGATSAPASDANGHAPSGDGSVRIDIADRASAMAEDFVTGLLPGDLGVSIDWGALSPIFSVVADVAGVAGLLVGWL